MVLASLRVLANTDRLANLSWSFIHFMGMNGILAVWGISKSYDTLAFESDVGQFNVRNTWKKKKIRNSIY